MPTVADQSLGKCSDVGWGDNPLGKNNGGTCPGFAPAPGLGTNCIETTTFTGTYAKTHSFSINPIFLVV
jgi:hypothetical protein